LMMVLLAKGKTQFRVHRYHYNGCVVSVYVGWFHSYDFS
jgi:hypothetical protein